MRLLSYSVFLSLCLVHVGTTFVIKEGDVVVGTWVEDDGSDATEEILLDEVKAVKVPPKPLPTQPPTNFRKPAKDRRMLKEKVQSTKVEQKGGWYLDAPGHDRVKSRNHRKRPYIIYMTADWCGPCKIFERGVLANSKVQQMLQKFDRAKIDIDNAREIYKTYPTDAIPAFFAISREGKIKKIKFNTTPADFIKRCQAAGLK